MLQTSPGGRGDRHPIAVGTLVPLLRKIDELEVLGEGVDVGLDGGGLLVGGRGCRDVVVHDDGVGESLGGVIVHGGKKKEHGWRQKVCAMRSRLDNERWLASSRQAFKCSKMTHPWAKRSRRKVSFSRVAFYIPQKGDSNHVTVQNPVEKPGIRNAVNTQASPAYMNLGCLAATSLYISP
jgi:hypothetical protein